MIIASGKQDHPLSAIESGARSSWFAPSGTPVTARKTWIAGQLQPAGFITVDDGAERALGTGKSLLPAGVRAISGEFSRGDTVAIVGSAGVEIARGLSSYDAAEAGRSLARNPVKSRRSWAMQGRRPWCIGTIWSMSVGRKAAKGEFVDAG